MPAPDPSPRLLVIEGATEHNLQDLDLTLERGTWTSIVGPSGSGKTTLVFDTLVREGERRYLGSLSSRARQFFGKLGRAEVRSLSGLPVPVAVGRRSVTRNPRSTVGTQSGVLDLLRLVFARVLGQFSDWFSYLCHLAAAFSLISAKPAFSPMMNWA
jgi:excinuclease ABC subunit A